jgi:CubicO group peptidase (beta-lactamase class C family)
MNSLTVFVITVHAVLRSASTPYVALARDRLIDPLTLVHTAFGSTESQQTWKANSKRLFSNECDQDRLNVGPIHCASGGIAFGVSSKPTA